MDSQSFEESPNTRNSNDFGENEQEAPRWSSLWLAWAAIIASLALAFSPHFFGRNGEDGESSIAVPEIYAKYLIGLSNLPFAPKDDFRDVIASVFSIDDVICPRGNSNRFAVRIGN